MRTLPLTIQEDVIRQRLSYAARIQAAWRGQGWVIDPAFIEHKAEIHVGTDVVSARIDRIDRHATSGAICVMDYKTGHRAGDPAKSHLKSIGRADDGLWSFAYTPDERKRWADLQLPMYAAACRSLFPDSRGDVHAAYFLLPSAVTDTAVAVFEGLNDELVDSARTCAASIFRRVRAGVFWPPIDDCGDRDALEPVFMGDVVANLAPAFRAELERRAAAFDGGAG